MRILHVGTIKLNLPSLALRQLPPLLPCWHCRQARMRPPRPLLASLLLPLQVVLELRWLLFVGDFKTPMQTTLLPLPKRPVWNRCFARTCNAP